MNEGRLNKCKTSKSKIYLQKLHCKKKTKVIVLNDI